MGTEQQGNKIALPLTDKSTERSSKISLLLLYSKLISGNALL